jgi:methionyl-tRNA formyltransferase
MLLSPRGGGGPEEKRVILEEMAVAEQPSRHVDEELSGEVCRDGDGRSVVWIEQTDGELREENEKEEGQGEGVGVEDGDKTATRLRYFTQDTDKDAGAVVVKMPDRSWLRIGRIKVEGMTSKPARRVLESVGVR